MLLEKRSAFNKKYREKGGKRVVLRLSPVLAPYKVAVLPLIKKNHAEKANEVFELYNEYFSAVYDESANIGKRYRRQDAIGTPFCVTVDDNTINEGTVTVRDRDTMEQITLKVEEVIDYINKKLKF